mgnify:CR=1 FL=1
MNEALDEIKEKIELLNEEQDHIDSKRESRVSMIIAVFGFVSIIAAALQILDYLSSGRGGDDWGIYWCCEWYFMY